MSKKPKWKKNQKEDSNLIDRRGFLNLGSLVALGSTVGLNTVSKVAAGTTSTPLSGQATQTIPTPSLWYRNSGLSSYSNGSNITNWTNEGSLGSTYNLVTRSGYNPPTKQTQDGFNAAHFTSHVLRFSNGSSIRMLPSNAYNRFTVFMVFKKPSVDFGFFSGYPTNSSGLAWYSSASSFYHVFNGDGRPFSISTPTFTSISQFGVRTGTSTSNNSTYTYWNAATSGLSSTSYSTYSDNLDITGIGFARSSQYMNGYLYELMMYQNALTDSEVNLVRQYLATTFSGTGVAS